MSQAKKLTEKQLRRLAAIYCAMTEAPEAERTPSGLRDYLGLPLKTTVVNQMQYNGVAHGVLKKLGAGAYQITKKGDKVLAPYFPEYAGNKSAQSAVLAQKPIGASSSPALPTTATEESAVAGIVGLIDENKRLRGILQRFQIEIGNALKGV